MKLNNTYFLMRHGQSLANIKHLVISDPKNGVNHFGLSVLGKLQVQDSILKNKDLNKDTIIYSSDFKRARETAEIVSKFLKSKKPNLSKALRERHLGVYEKGKDNIYHKLWAEDIKGKTLKSCESVNSVVKRVKAFINYIEKKQKGKSILLVAHGDIISIGLSVLNNKDAIYHHKLFSILKNAEIKRANTTHLKRL